MAENPEEEPGAEPDETPEDAPPRRGGFMAWTGRWWPASGRFGSMWGGEPKPIPGTGDWVNCESELARDQWENRIWHRIR